MWAGFLYMTHAGRSETASCQQETISEYVSANTEALDLYDHEDFSNAEPTASFRFDADAKTGGLCHAPPVFFKANHGLFHLSRPPPSRMF